MIDKYELLTDEIKAFTEKIESDELLDDIRNKYYKGIQILLSPLVFKPTFMFIGINPGIGYFKEYNKNVKRFKPLEHFEYLHFNYQLARETKNVFDKAGLTEQLTNSVKTNCYFFATATADDLHKFMSHLKVNYNVYYKSRQWIKELISIVQPQIIICEGKGAFEELVGKVNTVEQDTEGCYSSTYNGVPIIGYKRNFSMINKKDNLAKLISQMYASINK